ncbi:GDP-mannose transporter into the lumen of the Golgi [Gaertneriomyces sp. JEL0708]|nr:GDP-mannose transporter into the lumen of the Golgi [Gaertneriomyces sp. JEL0708]
MAVTNSPALAILSYCVSSILMTVTNKLVLSSYDFKMNFLLLAIQSFLCVATLETFAGLGLLSHRKLQRHEAKQWFIVSFSLVTMIYTGSKALQYLSIPVFTIFKNLTIILIAVAERRLLHGAAVTRLMMVSFALMVVSSIIAGWADIAAGRTMKKNSRQVGFIVAYGWMGLNCITTAMYALLMKAKIRQVNFKEFDTVYYNNLLAIPILLIATISMEGAEARRTYDKYFATTSDSSDFRGLVWGIVISGIASFGISYSTAWCMRVTSSTTYSMVGALNKLPIAVAGMVFFSDPVTFGGVAGVIIAFVAGLLYNHAKTQQRGLQPVSDTPLSELPAPVGTRISYKEVPAE